MSEIAFEASPLSRQNIRALAAQFRAVLGYGNKLRIDVEGVIEFTLPQKFPNFAYDIRTVAEMGNSHGLADPDNRFIIVREDIYERACAGEGRDRLTVYHEIGHVLMHTKDRIVLRRGIGDPKRYCDPEWQANAFAGEVLVPAHLVRGLSGPGEVAMKCGVSVAAAEFQWSCLQREGLV